MNPEQRKATVNMLPRTLAILPPLLPDVHSAARFRVAPTLVKRTRSYVHRMSGSRVGRFRGRLRIGIFRKFRLYQKIWPTIC